MRASLANGSNFWNAAEFYGTPEYNSLHLLERYFTKYPEDAEKVVLCIKGCLNNMRPDGSVENVRRSVDNCLKLLNGKKSIDVFEIARIDRDVPLETTLKELEKYVQEGKIGGIAISEVSAATIKKAVKITKIVAVEVEVSLWSTGIFQNGVAAACAENNLPVVACVFLRLLHCGLLLTYTVILQSVVGCSQVKSSRSMIFQREIYARECHDFSPASSITIYNWSRGWSRFQRKRAALQHSWPLAGSSL